MKFGIGPVKSARFAIHNMIHNEDRIATVLSRHDTQVYVLYTDDALYLGARCADAHPESLIVVSSERDHAEEYLQDLVEFFFDPDFDKKHVAKITINSTGAVNDSVNPHYGRSQKYDYSWSVDSESAGYVGDDFWSIEYRVEFGQQPQIPQPERGDRWGVDVQRGFRNTEWSLWTVDEGSMEYGWFLFQ